MSYWHLVDLLLVVTFLTKKHPAPASKKDNELTASNVANLIVGFVMNVFFAAYLMQNIQPEVIAAVHFALGR